MGYGIHPTWPYVCITKYWVDEWTLAMSFDPSKRLTLSYETILKATLVHELSHWLLTLKLGIHSKEYVDALDQNQHKLLSKQTLRDEEKHCTPKSMKPEWSTKAGEVGHYVEVKAGGGIAGFSIRREEVYFQTGAISFWSPCTEFLISMRNKGYTHFTPGPRDWIIKSPPVFIKISKCSPDIPISPSPSCWSDSDGGMLTSESQGEGEWFQMDPEEEIPKHGPSWITSPSDILAQRDHGC